MWQTCAGAMESTSKKATGARIIDGDSISLGKPASLLSLFERLDPSSLICAKGVHLALVRQWAWTARAVFRDLHWTLFSKTIISVYMVKLYKGPAAAQPSRH